jgi:hypothetical protein
MRKTLLALSLLVVLVLAGLVPGCSCNNDSSAVTDGTGGGGTAGVAQALVFTTPT